MLTIKDLRFLIAALPDTMPVVTRVNGLLDDVCNMRPVKVEARLYGSGLPRYVEEVHKGATELTVFEISDGSAS